MTLSATTTRNATTQAAISAPSIVLSRPPELAVRERGDREPARLVVRVVVQMERRRRDDDQREDARSGDCPAAPDPARERQCRGCEKHGAEVDEVSLDDLRREDGRDVRALHPGIGDEDREGGDARDDECARSRVVLLALRSRERGHSGDHGEDAHPDRERADRPGRVLDDPLLPDERRLPPRGRQMSQRRGEGQRDADRQGHGANAVPSAPPRPPASHERRLPGDPQEPEREHHEEDRELRAGQHRDDGNRRPRRRGVRASAARGRGRSATAPVVASG